MNISEVRIKLVPRSRGKLLAFGSVTINDEFVIRDLKIVKGSKGPFVAMPSRKLTDRCRKCGGKNHLRASYCNDCGSRLANNRASRDSMGRIKLHADIAHPINSSCRDDLQSTVLKAFQEELDSSKKPGYKPKELYGPGDDYDDYDDYYEEGDSGDSGEGEGDDKKKRTDFGDGIFT